MWVNIRSEMARYWLVLLLAMESIQIAGCRMLQRCVNNTIDIQLDCPYGEQVIIYDACYELMDSCPTSFTDNYQCEVWQVYLIDQLRAVCHPSMTELCSYNAAHPDVNDHDATYVLNVKYECFAGQDGIMVQFLYPLSSTEQTFSGFQLSILTQKYDSLEYQYLPNSVACDITELQQGSQVWVDVLHLSSNDSVSKDPQWSPYCLIMKSGTTREHICVTSPNIPKRITLEHLGNELLFWFQCYTDNRPIYARFWIILTAVANSGDPLLRGSMMATCTSNHTLITTEDVTTNMGDSSITSNMTILEETGPQQAVDTGGDYVYIIVGVVIVVIIVIAVTVALVIIRKRIQRKKSSDPSSTLPDQSPVYLDVVGDTKHQDGEEALADRPYYNVPETHTYSDVVEYAKHQDGEGLPAVTPYYNVPESHTYSDVVEDAKHQDGEGPPAVTPYYNGPESHNYYNVEGQTHTMPSKGNADDTYDDVGKGAHTRSDQGPTSQLKPTAPVIQSDRDGEQCSSAGRRDIYTQPMKPSAQSQRWPAGVEPQSRIISDETEIIENELYGNRDSPGIPDETEIIENELYGNRDSPGIPDETEIIENELYGNRDSPGIPDETEIIENDVYEGL